MSYIKKEIRILAGHLYNGAMSQLSAFQNRRIKVCEDDPKIPTDFTPVVQFVAASDSHTRNDRVKGMVEKARELCKGTSYEKIDAALIAGDFTGHGSSEDISDFSVAIKEVCGTDTEPFVCLGNHEFKTPDIYERYKSLTGWDVDRHTVINGVHFIAVSYDRKCLMGPSKQKWLKKELKKAAEDAPNMPIIVIQHPHPAATVYGSVHWGAPGLNHVLDDYPQVINFSGHSHYPINDPRSVWQGGFTAVGCGGLNYYELELELDAGQFPKEEESAGSFWLVGIDKNGSVALRAYDLYSGGFYEKAACYIAEPCNKARFAYTHKGRSNADAAPVFPADAQVSIEKNENGETVATFTAATDRYIVHDYKYKLTSSDKTVLYKSEINEYYYVTEKDTVSVNLGVLDACRNYELSIVAANAYYKLSKPLKHKFTSK